MSKDKTVKPMSVSEVHDLLGSTLHGSLPKETMFRVFATLGSWAIIVERNATMFDAIDGLNESLKLAKEGAAEMVKQVERGDYGSLLETAMECETAMGELTRITESLLKDKPKNGE